MLKNIFKTAWRNLLRHRVNTIINVAGLALGIVVCLIIFLLVRFELGYDHFHPDGDRIYRLVANRDAPGGDGVFGFMPDPAARDMRNEISGLETVAGIDVLNKAAVIVPREGKEKVVFDAPKQGEELPAVALVQREYFDIFPYQWLAGNPATALNDPFRVVLTAKEATKYFGGDDPDQWMGRKLIYRDSLEVTVSGIVADWKNNSDFGFRDFISFATIRSSFVKNDFDFDNWGMWDWGNYVVVKLAPGVSPARVQAQLPAFLNRHSPPQPGDPDHFALALQPLADIHFNEKYSDAFSRKANLPTLYGLAGIAVFILLIAAINFINLSTAQSVRRAREIGVRKVLGSRRGAIVLQFLCETMVLVLAATALAVLIANPLLIAFRSLLPREVELVVFQWPTAIFLAITTLVTCLLAGWYPARVLAAYQPVLSLKGQGIQQLNNKSYLRKALIVFQFTVSLIFIIGTLIVARQIHFVLSTDLGFDHDAIVNIPTDRDGTRELTASNRALLAQKFRDIPGVELVARSMGTPLDAGHWGTYIEYKGAQNHRINDASFENIDTNYLRLFGMKLAAGRDLFLADTMREFLINETCAQQLGFRHPADALGKVVEVGMNGGHGPIVGVVKDFHLETMHVAIKPFFISSFTRMEDHVNVKLATAGLSGDQVGAIVGQLQKAYKEVYPTRKFKYSFFDETIGRLYDRERKLAEILNIAMGIAIFISCLGLFGLASWVAEQRTKEIGIRKVLGATVGNIVTMLSKDFLWLVGLAILIASPVAWYFMHKWLEDFAYRVPISWWIYAVAGGAAIGIAAATVSFQAIRAATANPTESLKVE